MFVIGATITLSGAGFIIYGAVINNRIEVRLAIEIAKFASERFIPPGTIYIIIGIVGIIFGLYLLGIEIIAKVYDVNNRKCNFCKNKIKKEATVCQFCGKDLPKELYPHIAIKETTLRRTPYLNSKIISKLNAGEKIEFIEYLDTNKAWSYVKTSNQKKGWCFTNDFEEG